jgi:hypothetical protein
MASSQSRRCRGGKSPDGCGVQGRPDVGQERRLVVLDDPEVVPAAVEDLAAQVPLAEDGVAGDQAALQDQAREQPESGLVLVGLLGAAAGHLGLGHRQPRPVGHQGQQVDGLAQPIEAAAGRLAVQRQGVGGGLVGRGDPAQQGLGPAGQGGLQGGRRHGHEHLADAAGLGGPPGESEAVHQLDVMVVGPLGDGRIAAGAAQDGAAGQRQDRRQGMLAAMAAAGIGDLAEEVEQA